MIQYRVVESFEGASLQRLMARGGPATGLKQLMAADAVEKALTKLMEFKKSERKDDPERRQGLHGIYEQIMLIKTGRLTPDYYDSPDDATPWGLRIQESKSNILWQVLSGFVDKTPSIAAAYLGLALDDSLSVDEYARELQKLHQDCSEYFQADQAFHAHGLSGLSHKYREMACPACSIATALAVSNEGMNTLFKQLIPLKPEERIEFLRASQLMPLLNIKIPTSNDIASEPS